MNMVNFIDQYDLWVRVLVFVLFAMAVMIPLTKWAFGKKKEHADNIVFAPQYSTPKQELTQLDYVMMLDSMLLFGIIDTTQYQDYLVKGLPYFE